MCDCDMKFTGDGFNCTGKHKPECLIERERERERESVCVCEKREFMSVLYV